MCSASTSADIVINKSTVYVQSGLKYKSLWRMSRNNSLHYITLGHKTTTILIFFFRKDWDAVLLVRLLGKQFHS